METKADTLQKTANRDANYYYSLINTDVEKGFSCEEKSEIKNAISRALLIPSKKIFDYRVTFWFFQRLYLVIFLGKDIRARGRHTPGTSPVVLQHLISIFLCSILFFPIILLLFFVIYMIKSYLGINIFEVYHLSDFINWIKQSL